MHEFYTQPKGLVRNMPSYVHLSAKAYFPQWRRYGVVARMVARLPDESA